MSATAAKLSRCKLAHLPTPLEELRTLTMKIGGPKIFIKRDDQTGLALGGNKVRKLEFLLADALAQGCDTLITLGAAQSNHCRQTAAAAAACSLKCELILNGKKPELPQGNLFLDELFGATIHWIERSQRAAKSAELMESLTKEGRKPYLIPVGGSNGIGALGYVTAMTEFMEQLNGRRINRIVFGTSSGGTQAGMVVGARVAGFKGQLTAIGIDKDERDLNLYEQELAEIANDSATRFGIADRFTPKDFEVIRGYAGGGYGIVGDLERNAIRTLAQTEGILLDPVYAGRAFGAMLDMIQKGQIAADETVLFWHTGGAPALFAYVKDLAI
ncbi:MAG: D-cysteine desulfhydrase [Verrucomicrobiales bacterium]|nr:D-cysteine desulfhydrase [Verrucomicrobiales bacterium]